MPDLTLTEPQVEVSSHALDGRIFLSGPAGCGKTTTALNWITNLARQSISLDKLLVLVPQRSLALPYYELITKPDFPENSLPTIATFAGLAQRMVDLFWPEISSSAGFAHPNQPPRFLTLETSQYFMAKIVNPLIQKGYFENLSLDRNRLYSQILDNLNKSALIGYEYDSFASRLKSAWIGDESQVTSYDQAQEAAILFRKYCLENNLLDFSLQVDTFVRHLWKSFLVNTYLHQSFQFLVFENTEEESPVCHDVIREWLPTFQSTLLLFDENAGYRTFLGADPISALSLSNGLEHKTLSGSFVNSKEISCLYSTTTEILAKTKPTSEKPSPNCFTIQSLHYIPEMCSNVADRVEMLIKQEAVNPSEIVVFSPYLSDSLQFSIIFELEKRGIAATSSRPSRSLREEPASRAMLTLAWIAHPEWGYKPHRVDVSHCLMQLVTSNDLVRADLLAQILYSPSRTDQIFGSFDTVNSEMRDRITYSIGNKFNSLNKWLSDYLDDPTEDLDVFWSRLFGELLSQPEFGFHDDFQAAKAASALIESFQKCRRVWQPVDQVEALPIGKDFLQMVESGVLSASYLQNARDVNSPAVQVSPAYAFLLINHPVDYQFWLDIGSQGWWQRPDQPLTQPYVLSRNWTSKDPWTDVNEMKANQEMMNRLVKGLILRCRKHIYFYQVSTNERGMEEKGPLLLALNRLKKHLAYQQDSDV